MSGKESFDILKKIFVPVSNTPEKGYSIKYGKIYDVLDKSNYRTVVNEETYENKNKKEKIKNIKKMESH